MREVAGRRRSGVREDGGREERRGRARSISPDRTSRWMRSAVEELVLVAEEREAEGIWSWGLRLGSLRAVEVGVRGGVRASLGMG